MSISKLMADSRNKPPLTPSYRPDGGVMDLADPDQSEVHFLEIAETLAKTARFGGRNRGPKLSVAQHCVMGAEALVNEASNIERAEGTAQTIAAYFLLHDAHEAFIGDFQKPVVDEIARRLDGIILSHVPRRGAGAELRTAIAEFKAAWDEPIYRKAGLLPPSKIDAAMQRRIHEMDLRMGDAEALALFGPEARHRLVLKPHNPPMLNGAIKCWPEVKAAEKWIECFERYVGRMAR